VFENADVLDEHVRKGHFDLVSSDGELILPSSWKSVRNPGMALKMYMWPLSELKHLHLDVPPRDFKVPDGELHATISSQPDSPWRDRTVSASFDDPIENGPTEKESLSSNATGIVPSSSIESLSAESELVEPPEEIRPDFLTVHLASPHFLRLNLKSCNTYSVCLFCRWPLQSGKAILQRLTADPLNRTFC
jgi:hypothetical protein